METSFKCNFQSICEFVFIYFVEHFFFLLLSSFFAHSVSFFHFFHQSSSSRMLLVRRKLIAIFDRCCCFHSLWLWRSCLSLFLSLVDVLNSWFAIWRREWYSTISFCFGSIARSPSVSIIFSAWFSTVYSSKAWTESCAGNSIILLMNAVHKVNTLLLSHLKNGIDEDNTRNFQWNLLNGAIISQFSTIYTLENSLIRIMKYLRMNVKMRTINCGIIDEISIERIVGMFQAEIVWKLFFVSMWWVLELPSIASIQTHTRATNTHTHIHAHWHPHSAKGWLINGTEAIAWCMDASQNEYQMWISITLNVCQQTHVLFAKLGGIVFHSRNHSWGAMTGVRCVV